MQFRRINETFSWEFQLVALRLSWYQNIAFDGYVETDSNAWTQGPRICEPQMVDTHYMCYQLFSYLAHPHNSYLFCGPEISHHEIFLPTYTRQSNFLSCVFAAAIAVCLVMRLLLCLFCCAVCGFFCVPFGERRVLVHLR